MAVVTQRKDNSARLKLLESGLRNFADDCTRIADALAHEIMTGRCIRQSPESKQARVDIMRLHADWANRLLTPDQPK